MISLLLNGLRHSFRRVLKNPGFTLVVALTLALGIGANAAILSVVNGVLLRPLPFDEPDRLVTVYHHYPSLDDLKAPVSPAGFNLYSERNKVFESWAVETSRALTMTGQGIPERVEVSMVSGDYFKALGIQPFLGRALDKNDDQPGNDKVVVLSHGFWERVYGGSQGVLGEKLELDSEVYEVVGVMPAEFHSFFRRNAELWKPLALTPDVLASAHNEYLNVTARLGDGISLEQATSDFLAITQGIHDERPGSYPPDWKLLVVTINELQRGDIRPALMMLMAAVGFVLLIACANVANLFLARSAARQREVALCQALGAPRWRIAGQVIGESLVLALAGGALGLLLAFFGMKLFVHVTLEQFAQRIAFDGTVMLLTAGVTLLAALVAGILPALLSTGGNLIDPLREGARGGDRRGQTVRRALIVLEMAVALVLLVGSGLLVRSFMKIQDVDPGFRSDQLLTGNVALPRAVYPEGEQQRAFFDRLLNEISALPGVEAAGATSVLPFGGSWSTTSFNIEGLELAEDQRGPWGDIRVVTPDFLKALKAPLIRGRHFESTDGPDSLKVAIVDEEMVRRFLGDRDPLGTRLSFFSGLGEEPEMFEIVGVVGHTMHEGLDAQARIQVYLPASQLPRGGMALAIRAKGDGDPMALAAGVRQTLNALDPNVPFSRIHTMDKLVQDSLGSRRFSMWLLGVFSGLALLLSAVGIYGVMSYSVTQRAREMGVRLALGAARGSVLGLVLRQGLILAGLGAALGALGAFALTRLIASQLFGVGATDVVTFLGVTAVLLGSAVLATFVPALRATRLNPATILRAD